MKNQKFKRRGILGKLLLFGSAFAIGLKTNSVLKANEVETIRLIGKDGKVHEVERKNLNKMCSGKVSNKRLLSWLNKKDSKDGQIR